ncbi:MAG: PKD domain-containing protein, partial [Campylobacterota bacterium]|nr:PKD domain-containing protein [Campylobacterota bacterium]
MFLKLFYKVIVTLLFLGTVSYANTCPKWFPMPSGDGLVVVIPIYDESITQPDLDCDGIIDSIDTDIDGDGVVNTVDAFPRDSKESVDTDGDGIGNNADRDDDNDGTDDAEDSNPLFNEIPVAHAGEDIRQDVDTRIVLDASASSDDGTTLTYSWVFTNKPEESTATLTNSTSATPTFHADKVGTYRLELVVSDGILTSTKDVVFVNVGRE